MSKGLWFRVLVLLTLPPASFGVGALHGKQYLTETKIRVVEKVEVIRTLQPTEYDLPIEATAYFFYEGKPASQVLKLRPGTIAVSRDLFNRGYTFGTKVYLEGLGVYTVVDFLHPRWRNRVDIWIPSERAAKKHGNVKTRISKIIET